MDDTEEDFNAAEFWARDELLQAVKDSIVMFRSSSVFCDATAVDGEPTLILLDFEGRRYKVDVAALDS